MITATIANCKVASIRKFPSLSHTLYDEKADVVAEISKGSKIKMDLEKFCYDWKGNKYFFVSDSILGEGYLREGTFTTD